MTEDSSNDPELSEDAFYDRLAFEYDLIMKSEERIEPVKRDLQVYEGEIEGSGIYEDGWFKIKVELSRKYPYTPPKVTWRTKIWHPNVSDSESPSHVQEICLSILTKDAGFGWKSGNNILSVFEAIRGMMENPNPDSALNSEAANQMKTHPKQFEEKVREYIRRFAKCRD